MKNTIDIRLITRLLIQFVAMFSAVLLLGYLFFINGGMELQESIAKIMIIFLCFIAVLGGALLVELLIPLRCKACEVGKLRDIWTTDFAVLQYCDHCNVKYKNFKYDTDST